MAKIAILGFGTVGSGVYEVLRQWDFPELLDHGHLRDYEWK